MSHANEFCNVLRMGAGIEVLEDILAGVANPRYLPLALLEDITEQFSEERKIGEGGFGTVYKGLLHNGDMVAVKKIRRAILSSRTQFENEVNLLMKLKHQNIVRLVGYCYETRHLHMGHEEKSIFADDTESLLCLECLPNGSLDKYISDASSGLNWHTRFKVIEGISYGLQYLHEHSNEPIIHLDLKPANILLDANMLPKITDFGLSRLFDQNKTIHTVHTYGTFGYMSAEFLRGIITPMADIFSLGVIILEVITGHKDYPYDIGESSKGFIELELQKWRNMLQKEPGYTSLETDCQQIEGCIQIGLICVNPERTKRPTLKKIISMLEVFKSMNGYISNEDIGSSNLFLPPLMYCKPLESISWNLSTSLTSDRTVDLATGAIGSLLPKLSELRNKYDLETSISGDVDCVIQELTVMRAELCDLSDVERDNNNKQIMLAKLWAHEVRELSYYIEDLVDDFLMPIKGLEPATNTVGLMGLIQKIGVVIKDIKKQVQYKSGWKGKYKVKEVVANTVSTINDHHLSALFEDREKLFGIDDAMKDLTNRLRGADGNGDVYGLKVHSIFGSGGLGKTTLARAVYNQLKGSFRLTAFVTVGRNPDAKKLLDDILFELDERSYIKWKTTNLDKRKIIKVLRKLLENNRYLIVIDDVWDKKVWDDLIKFACVDSKCESKIIITTRIFEVAAIATDVYKLDPLSPGYAEELFYATLSPEEGRCEYDVTGEVIEKILLKCGGVPLAIITIASLLASKRREDWPKVYNSVGFGDEANDDADNTRKILLFSYCDLPRNLRTCLLHLSIFPEDRLIPKDLAIWKWVAEGFVSEEPGRGLFELGERYFDQLISRSMIQLVVQSQFRRKICFRIHDLVLDMICSLSRDENFVTLLRTEDQHTSSKNNARRLAVQKRGIKKPGPPDCMVQLRSFYATDCHIGEMPPLSSFKVLRVLSLEGCRFSEHQPYDLEHIGKLLQLRYLGLEGMPIHKLPEEIGDLLFLQTLILNGTKIKELPHSVGLLKQLKCLRATRCDRLEVPDWMVNMTSLEDLLLVGVNMPRVFAEGLNKLKELRDLHISVNGSQGYSWNRVLLKSVGNLLKLQSLHIHSWGNGDDIWEGFVPPRHLHSMIIWVSFSSVPPWMDSTHLSSLSYLELRLLNMESRCLEILGRFPQLHTLKLLTPGTPVADWLAVTGSGAFPKLRHLYTYTMLRFQRGVMPRLEYLELMVGVSGLIKENFDWDFTSLGNLPLLQKVRVELVTWGGFADPKYMKIMEAAVKHAVDTHPHRRPILHLDGLTLEEL